MTKTFCELEIHPMGLFTADLYRSFAIGFGLGALALAVTFGSQLLTAI